METLMNMPIADRKYYIMLHNKTEGGNSETHQENINLDDEKMMMMQQVKDWH